jgi:hypothetical protein
MICLMKALGSLFIFIVAILLLPSCRNTKTYDKYIKELDSLKVVVQQSVDNFKTVDSASCMEAYSKQYTYALFIDTHLKDTVTKSVAENLQNFHSIEKGLHDYVSLRSSWLQKANTSIVQLQTLSLDLKNASIDQEDAIAFINDEKRQAETIIEELKSNTESIRKHLDLYHQSLPVCENLIKQLNLGVLPQEVKPK